jgi:co-chaperonin GroES (HSP10)
MNKLLIALLISSGLAFIPKLPAVSIKNFKPAFGKWKGSLTYLDYSSGKPYTMPANVTISKDGNNTHQLILAFEYPDEPKANGNDTLVISSDGLQVDGATVVSKKKTSDGYVVIITEKDGVDGNDNRKAKLRHVYSIGKKKFSNRKEVRFNGEEKFIMRNEYVMGR